MATWKEMFFRLAELIKSDAVTDENPNHDPENGQFTTGGGGGIISVGGGPVKPTQILEGHERVPRTSKPNAIIETRNEVGGVGRTYYDGEGQISKQIHGNHNQPQSHPYGNNGEHAHDFIWENGVLKERTTREITEQERKENSDIL